MARISGSITAKPRQARVTLFNAQKYSSILIFSSYFVERRLAEKSDNARERALMMMMQGRLEANIEDELKKDLVPPEFITSKPQEEWSEEEQKAAKEFEKKKQQLQEDREKYRKSLETELKKLQSGITDATASFDEKLSQLFQRKVKTEMVIYQVGSVALINRSLFMCSVMDFLFWWSEAPIISQNWPTRTLY